MGTDNPEAVKLLLTHPYIDVNARNVMGTTPLSLATLIGSEEMVKALLAHPKIDATIPDMWGQTAFFYATETRNQAAADAIRTHLRKRRLE